MARKIYIPLTWSYVSFLIAMLWRSYYSLTIVQYYSFARPYLRRRINILELNETIFFVEMVLNDEKCSLYDFMSSVDEKYYVSNDDCYQWSFISMEIQINILVGNSLSVLKSPCHSDTYIHVFIRTRIYSTLFNRIRNVNE